MAYGARDSTENANKNSIVPLCVAAICHIFQTVPKVCKKFSNVSTSFRELSKRFQKCPRSFQTFPQVFKNFPTVCKKFRNICRGFQDDSKRFQKCPRSDQQSTIVNTVVSTVVSNVLPILPVLHVLRNPGCGAVRHCKPRPTRPPRPLILWLQSYCTSPTCHRRPTTRTLHLVNSSLKCPASRH